MPLNGSENMTLLIAGQQCDRWNEVEIDSDILTPADAWRLKLYNPPLDQLPDTVTAGADIQIKYQDQLVLTGVIDRYHQSVHHQEGQQIEISGRDMAGQLLDCSVDIFNGQSLTLQEIITKSLAGSSGTAGDQSIPIKIGNSAISTNVSNDRTAVEPGESIWAAIQKAAEAEGLYTWFDPEGTLMIGNPVADEPQPAQMPYLKLIKAGGKTSKPRVISLDFLADVAEVFSEIHILGQGTGTGQSFSAKRRNVLRSHRTLTNEKAAAYDGGASQTLQRRRLRIAVSGQAQNETEANDMADKALHDANLNAYTLTIEVAGWTCRTGEVWRPGWRVTVDTDAILGITGEAGFWIVFGRTLHLSRAQGKRTVLKLKRFQDWMQPVKQQTVLHDSAWRAERKAAKKAERKAAAQDALTPDDGDSQS